jgi:uncharacterized Zn-finger protein
MILQVPSQQERVAPAAATLPLVTKTNFCPICEKTSATRRAHLAHVKTHGETEKVKCSMCDKWFKSKHVLGVHKYNVHQPSPRMPCPICKKIFKTRQSEAQHLKRHEANIKITCSFCEKIFSNRNSLSCHLRSFHNVTSKKK